VACSPSHSPHIRAALDNVGFIDKDTPLFKPHFTYCYTS
jgi:hypothetical protein